MTGRILKTGANAALAMMVALITSSGVCFAQASTKAQTSSPTAATQNVSVVNTPTVNVATLPAVTVTGTVGITGTPEVRVGNTVPTQTTGPSLVTHMGQSPSNHVVLGTVTGTSCSTWFRIAADGHGSPFTIPAGNVLVITDVRFFGSSFAPQPYVVNLDVGGSGVMSTAVVVDATGVLFSEQRLTSGIVVSTLPTCGITGTSASPSWTIYGYLIPNN